MSGASHGTAGDRGFDTSPGAADVRLQYDSAIRDTRTLEHPAKALAWALKSNANGDACIRAGVEKLAGDAGLSRRAFFEQLAVVLEQGWAQRKRTGRASEYALAIPPAHLKCATRTSETQEPHLRSAPDDTSTEGGLEGGLEGDTEGGPLARAPSRASKQERVRSVIDEALG